MPVLRSYESPRGFVVLPVHYSHDPAKGPEWQRRERAKYQRPEEWQQEQEIDFSAWSGRPAYPSYSRRVHVAENTVEILPILPLCLMLDFNVSPMVWEIGQIRAGVLYVADEIAMAPATIDKCITEFRNRFPAHPAELWIYGDATGKSRTPQTGKTDYDLVTLGLRTYSAPIIFKVPASNPPVRDRLNDVNRRLRGDEGVPRVVIDKKCIELIADFEEVSLRPDGHDILKINEPTDPYHRRTHASDAVGYLISREWPVGSERVADELGKRDPRPPLRYVNVLGAIE